MHLELWLKFFRGCFTGVVPSLMLNLYLTNVVQVWNFDINPHKNLLKPLQQVEERSL